LVQRRARRHLDSGQRAAIAVEMLPLLEAEAAERRKKGKPDLSQKIDQGKPNENKAASQAAQVTGTNRQYVSDAKKLKAEMFYRKADNIAA
jgi:hypothetical protein